MWEVVEAKTGEVRMVEVEEERGKKGKGKEMRRKGIEEEKGKT